MNLPSSRANFLANGVNLWLNQAASQQKQREKKKEQIEIFKLRGDTGLEDRKSAKKNQFAEIILFAVYTSQRMCLENIIPVPQVFTKLSPFEVA